MEKERKIEMEDELLFPRYQNNLKPVCTGTTAKAK
jgi:hypothetical protein